ncbi:MAG: dihydroneopterin aldolase [Gammaproteobacteria bacterium]
MDIIFISDIRAETVIGVYDWEREIRQQVVMDLELGGDCARAAQTDAVEDTLDYKAISKRVSGFVEESSFKLVETLADRTAEMVMREFGVQWLRLRLNKKGALRGASDVGVIIERGQRSGAAP